MKTYARIVDGVVIELVQDTEEFTINELWPTWFVNEIVEVTNVNPMPEQLWLYDGTAFTAPVVPPLTNEEILANNSIIQAQLLNYANNQTLGMADAYILGLLSDSDAAKFKAWAQYKLSLGKVDITQQNPTWPVQPS